MQSMRQRLERTPTWFLAAYVAFVDAAVCLGIVPFEVYCRGVLGGGHAGIALLSAILAANVALMLVLLGAMAASTALISRGAKRSAFAVIPVLRARRPRIR